MSTRERFDAKWEEDFYSGCWIWFGATSNGYGHFWLIRPDGGRGPVRAHRFAYEMVNGPIPDGESLSHLCHVSNCVNPAHLIVEPLADNLARNAGEPKKVRRKARKRRLTRWEKNHGTSECPCLTCRLRFQN